MSEFPIYKGKPTAYLDQNVLDIFVKYGMSEFAVNLRDSFQVIYSDETLKEIKRSGDQADKFLDVLNNLNAFHLKHVLTRNFEPTDNVTITKRDAFEAYQEYCEQEPIYQQLQESLVQSNFKSFGGRKGDSFDQIAQEQNEVFSELMSTIREQARLLEKSHPELARVMDSYAEVAQVKMEVALKESTSLMKQNVKNELDWSGVKEFRSFVNIGPKELNNISAPNVLEKIWEQFKDKEPYCGLDWTLEDFFLIKKSLIYPDKPYFKYQKVTAIYNHLNFIGFHPDSKTYKERRFVAAMSDLGHASIASFAHALFSRDESFIIKTRAAYEYLGITTQVFLVNLENA
ncbi:hypothetical protein ACTQ8I_004284 [Vibrio vulnificus]|uniref:hypothetical protein n=2 Tax=Vibrio TaxID=662 RepID=UPI00130236A2|nr:hypothetical protein [Vibrio navarrensis]EHA1127665.1 hypothetical protein [Vibrio navarrensis]MCU8352673.1 hypothetical protein [Vibrio vulnificus]